MENNWKKKTIRFIAAQTISLFGSSLVQYAIIWYITLSTSSGVMMTIATLCGYIPQIGISLFAGVWIDRYDRKKLMMLADGAIALSTLAIALLYMAGYKELFLLFAVLIVRSAGTGIQTPAVNAFIPQIVPSEQLMKVNGINSTLNSLMMFLSPVVSGLILSLISIEATFFVDVVTAVIGIGIMFTIKADNPAAAPTGKEQKPALDDIKSGFLYLRNNTFVKHQLIYLMVIAVLISPSAFLTPLLINRTFGADIWRLTVSEMTFSFGAVIGGVLIASWGGFKNRQHTIIFASILYGGMMFGIGVSPIYAIYLIFNCLIGISMPCYNAPVTVSLQESVAPSMQGRIFSMVQIATSCALPLGTILFGPLADIISVQTILMINSTAVILFAVFALKSRSFFNMPQ